MPEEIYVNQLRDFNTSHVTVYPALILQCLVDNWISIHLMLLFILISFFPFIRFVHFNTSHVTVYPVPTRFFFILFKFQYISCYCLSLSSFLLIESPLISIHLMLLFIDVGDLWTQGSSGFQYISCYCLSRRSFLVSSGSWHFNTSHVTVYPWWSPNISLYSHISIHLMLLFILRWLRHLQVVMLHFNTSHVTVYLSGNCEKNVTIFISIHLMLLFIYMWQEILWKYQYFNTSHVTVYQFSNRLRNY